MTILRPPGMAYELIRRVAVAGLRVSVTRCLYYRTPLHEFKYERLKGRVLRTGTVRNKFGVESVPVRVYHTIDDDDDDHVDINFLIGDQFLVPQQQQITITSADSELPELTDGYTLWDYSLSLTPTVEAQIDMLRLTLMRHPLTTTPGLVSIVESFLV